MRQDTMHDGRGLRGGSRLALWGGAAALLLVPLVAMRFTDEVAWDGFDFLVMGVLLAVLCGACEVAAWMIRRASLRIVAFTGIALAFLLVWAELAVGIFGPG